jgi:hypothetical protein
MDPESEYKLAKERFYQGHSGGSSLEVVSITTLPPISVFLAQIVALCLIGSSRLRSKGSGQGGHAREALVSTLCITLPMYASFVKPEWSAIIGACQAFLAVIIAALMKGRSRSASVSLEVSPQSKEHSPMCVVYVLPVKHMQACSLDTAAYILKLGLDLHFLDSLLSRTLLLL